MRKKAAVGTRASGDQAFRYWQTRIFTTLWITYASYYLCRVNFSVALPGIMDEFGCSKAELGLIGTAFFWMYALGQFINGQIADRFGARKLVALGLLASAVVNILMGFSAILGAILILWGLNGYFQAMGWAPSVKTLANWFSLERRGRISGLLGSCYQIGNAVGWVLAGFLIARYGWRSAFWIPAALLLLSVIHWYTRIRNSPESIGLPTIEAYEGHGERVGNSTAAWAKAQVSEEEHLGLPYTLKQTIGNPRVWIVAWAFFFVDIVRYGFLLWAPTYLFETQKAGIDKAAYTVVAMPLAGALGAFFSGWATDRFFQSRRAPIITINLLLLGILAWAYRFVVPAGAWILSFMVLALIGFATYGAHVVMVATVPMDYGTRKAAGSATGFIDGFGYLGAGVVGVCTGFLVDRWGWDAGFYFWIVAAFVACALMALLWTYKPPKGKYL